MIPSSGTEPLPLSSHLRRTAALALPIIVARAALVVMFTVDTVMVGRAGPVELAYFGLGVAPQLTLMMICIGALQATAVLASQALGAGDARRAGAVLRAALAHALGLGLLVLALSSLAGPFFLATGQEADLAAGAARVSFAFGFGMPGVLLFVACNLFLEATGRPKTGMAIMLAANVVNVPLNMMFGFGWGGLVEPMGAEGVMVASSIARTLAGAAILAVLLLQARRDDAFQILPTRRLGPAAVGMWLDPDARSLRRLGLPMGLAQGVESAAFATVVMMAGRIGTEELAAYQATMTLVTLTFMMAIGTAGATAIRVGRAFGAHDGEGMGRAGWAGILLGAVWPVPVALLFLVAPETAALAITSDPATVAAAGRALFVAGFMLSVDAAMAVAIGALRGLGDVWWPTLLQIGAFWLVAVPCAYLTAITLELGAGGLIGGLIAGVVVSFTGLALRFRHRVAGRARLLGVRA
jgi:MATE family multidrug resistance protein